VEVDAEAFTLYRQIVNVKLFDCILFVQIKNCKPSQPERYFFGGAALYYQFKKNCKPSHQSGVSIEMPLFKNKEL